MFLHAGFDGDCVVIDVEEVGVDECWGSACFEVDDFEGEVLVGEEEFL